MEEVIKDTAIDSAPKLMTAKDVVTKVLGGVISYRTLLTMAKTELHCWRIGRRYYFDENEVRRWVFKNTSTPVWAKVRA